MDKVAIHFMEKVAEAQGVTPEQVRQIWESQFAFARDIIKDLDFNQVTNEEEFNEIRGSFSFPALFKLYPKYKTLMKILEANRKKNDETNQETKL